MTPKIVDMKVYPVAGRDSMLLNLSGAHAPYFTRNVLVLEDSSGNIGISEVPGAKDYQGSGGFQILGTGTEYWKL